MDKEEVMKLAREAGPLISTPFDVWCERFAALVAAADRSTFNFCPRCGKRNGPSPYIHTCTPTSDNWAYPNNNMAP